MPGMHTRRSRLIWLAAWIVGGMAALVAAVPAYARESYHWAHTLTGNQLQQATTIAYGGSNEVFVGGYFRGRIDFDPGPGERILDSGPAEAGFIAKYGPAGNLIWAWAITGSDHIRVEDMAVDVLQQIAVVGSFRGEADLDPGPAIYQAESEGSRDIFLLRLKVDGTLEWAFTAGDSGADAALSVAVDENYNIYLAGYYEGKVAFDPAPSKVVLESRGNEDAFAAHFTNYGRLLWAKSFGGSREDRATDIALDAKRQIYLTGTFEGEADLDPDYTDFEARSQGDSDIFALVLQVGGRLLTANHFGGSSNDDHPRLWVEPDGTFYVAGEFKATVDFNRAEEGGVVNSRGESDVFLLRYRPGQRFDWVIGIGSARTEEVGSLAQDTLGNVYLLGAFEETVDFEPGAGSTTLTSLSSDDLFVARYNAAGALRDVRHIFSGGDDTPADIAVDQDNQVLITGMFQGTVELGNGLTASGSVDGMDDVFAARLPAEFWSPHYADLYLPAVRLGAVAQE